ncbi:MAG: hypothetical protein SFU98_19445 [Leptospiraceae bacterium]|nr:hypothetical protein [Leptospiraceae bacterium]
MKFLKTTILATLVVANMMTCSKPSGGSAANIYLLANSIQSATKGNCAVSVNLESLYYGAIVQSAVSGGAATTTQSATAFDYLDYNSVTGETLTPAEWAAIPYNKRYDAFFTTTLNATWTQAARNAVLASAKGSADAVAYLGLAASLCSSNAATPGTTIAGALAGFRTESASVSGSLTAAEATAANTTLTAFGGTTTIEGAFTAAGCGAIGGSLALSYAGAGGSSTAASAYVNRVAQKHGAALLACARIPRSSCSFAALTTANIAAAKSSVVAAFDALNNNSDCRKSSANLMNNALIAQTTGLKDKDTITGFATRGILTGGDTLYPNARTSQGSTSTPVGNQIYAERAYPISTALANISANFALAFPLSQGTTSYSTTTMTGGANVNTKIIDSCAAIGLGVGPSPAATASKFLTSPAEILYSLSTNNTAATFYSAVSGSVTDSIACNKSFRSKFNTSSASTLNLLGEKLATIDTTSGDGASSSLTSTCVYGGSAATNSTVAAAFSTVIAGLNICPAAASVGASTFGNTGLNSISGTFPAKQ